MKYIAILDSEVLGLTSFTMMDANGKETKVSVYPLIATITVSPEGEFLVNQQLDVYKKAFELLAEDSTNSSLNEDTQELMDYYLHKAKGEEE